MKNNYTESELMTEILENITVSEYSPNTKKILKILPEGYEAYFINLVNIGQGVGIIMDLKEAIYEKFENTEIKYIEKLPLIKDEPPVNILFFYMKDGFFKVCNNDYVIRLFAGICCSFVSPSTRDNLKDDPLIWWNSIKEIFGNASLDSVAYPVVAELIAYNYLLEIGRKNIIWTGSDKKRIDFEFSEGKLEVKSTISRNEKKCTIHGLDQLEDGANLLLLVMEQSIDSYSVSIDSMIELLTSKFDISRSDLENHIITMGFLPNSSVRKQQFKVLHAYLYNIDKKFPRITSETLGRDLSYRVSNLEYKLSLENLENTEITKEVTKCLWATKISQ